MSEKGDKCQRCGEVGQDRRTIFSACMYEMQETGIPFDQVKIKGTFHEKTGMKDTAFGPVPAFSEEGSRTEHQFYTILVCKSCRADYMSAMKQWFFAGKPAKNPAANIPVRVNGANKMVTAEEYQRMYPGRTPIILKESQDA